MVDAVCEVELYGRSCVPSDCVDHSVCFFCRIDKYLFFYRACFFGVFVYQTSGFLNQTGKIMIYFFVADVYLGVIAWYFDRNPLFLSRVHKIWGDCCINRDAKVIGQGFIELFIGFRGKINAVISPWSWCLFMSARRKAGNEQREYCQVKIVAPRLSF